MAAGQDNLGSQRRHETWEKKEGRGGRTPGFTLSKAHFSWVYSANLLMKESSFSGIMTL